MTDSSGQWCRLHDCRQDDPDHDYEYPTCERHLRVATAQEEEQLASLNDSQLEAIRAAAVELFAAAVAQGMHSPFALNCESWGHTYAERLIDELTPEEADDV